MAMFRSKQDLRPAVPFGTVPPADAAAAEAARDNWFDSSWELRRGLQVAELELAPEDLERGPDPLPPAAPGRGA
jgi:hypothetical protein